MKSRALASPQLVGSEEERERESVRERNVLCEGRAMGAKERGERGKWEGGAVGFVLLFLNGVYFSHEKEHKSKGNGPNGKE